MKKAYQKPRIFYESFRLSETIAAGCQFISTMGDPYVCSLDTGDGEPLFAAGGVCVQTPPPGDDTICLHIPSDILSGFTS